MGAGQENNVWLPTGRAARRHSTLLPCSTFHRLATLSRWAGPRCLFSDLAQARPGKLEMGLNVQDVVRTALLPGYIVLSGPAIARGAMLVKKRVPVSTANRMRIYLIVFLLQGPVITMALVYLITFSLHAK